MKKIIWMGLFCLSCPFIANAEITPAATPSPVSYTYQVLAERSHKASLFTQGLVLDQDIFYESSGLYGRSMLVSYPKSEPLGKWIPITTPFSQKKALSSRYFAEGLTLFDNKLYLLTWQEGTVFVYDKTNFTLLKQMTYSGEGWGLTHTDNALIRSDGSNRLYFHDPENFKITKTINVLEQGRPVHKLNELEFINGFIWSNVWHEDRLVRINPDNGTVVGSVDLSTLVAHVDVANSESVLNGIAYDEQQDALWITGKNWPSMYKIKVIIPE